MWDKGKYWSTFWRRWGQLFTLPHLPCDYKRQKTILSKKKKKSELMTYVTKSPGICQAVAMAGWGLKPVIGMWCGSCLSFPFFCVGFSLGFICRNLAVKVIPQILFRWLFLWWSSRNWLFLAPFGLTWVLCPSLLFIYLFIETGSCYFL